jgi:hypothetical protein
MHATRGRPKAALAVTPEDRQILERWAGGAPRRRVSYRLLPNRITHGDGRSFARNPRRRPFEAGTGRG